MKDRTAQFDRARAAMRKVMDETPEHLRYPVGAPANRYAEALWWIGFLVCLGILIYGTFSL